MCLLLKKPFPFLERAFAIGKAWFGKIWDDKDVTLLRMKKNLVVNPSYLYAKEVNHVVW